MKVIKMLTTATLCTLTLSMANAASVQINNPSFEERWKGWDESDPSAISGEGYDGSRSAKFEGDGAKAAQVVPIEEGTDYTLSVRVKGKGSIGVVVGGETKTTDVASSGWEQATVSFNSGSNTEVSVFAAYKDGKGRFDLFTLESH